MQADSSKLADLLIGPRQTWLDVVGMSQVLIFVFFFALLLGILEDEKYRQIVNEIENVEQKLLENMVFFPFIFAQLAIKLIDFDRKWDGGVRCVKSIFSLLQSVII